MSASDRWLRVLGTACRAFADAVDTELSAPAAVANTDGETPPAAPRATAKPTEQVIQCPLCGDPARPAPKSGRSWFRCDRGHHFDRNTPPIPLA